VSFRPPAAEPVVHIVMPKGATHDLKLTEKTIASALGRLGCDHCHSGFDIRLIEAEVILVANKQGVVEPGQELIH
jgi:hypothetical protein